MEGKGKESEREGKGRKSASDNFLSLFPPRVSHPSFPRVSLVNSAHL